MQKILFAALVAGAISCSTGRQNSNMTNDNTSAGKADEWIPLFDGKTTKGWHSYGKATAGKAWKAENGALRLDAASKKDWQVAEGGDLVTDEEFENFHLKLEWKVAPKANSGIIFFVHEDTSKYRYTWHTGPEMQVLDNGEAGRDGHPDAKITSHRAGDLYDLIVSKEAVKPVGEWNQIELVANKGKLDFYMNGQHTLSTTMWDDNWNALVAKSKFKAMKGFGTFRKGRIGLQDHGDDVWFRNIVIKRL